MRNIKVGPRISSEWEVMLRGDFGILNESRIPKLQQLPLHVPTEEESVDNIISPEGQPPAKVPFVLDPAWKVRLPGKMGES